MIGLMTKYWKPILDVLLIAALVVFLFLWNPFNIFGGKAKLESTANMVSKIRGIGELVTAEYYGEVITTYQDAKLEFFEEEESEEVTMVSRLYQELKGKIINDYLDQLDELEKQTKKKDRKRFARGIEASVTDAAYAFLEDYYFDVEDNLADNLLMFLKRHKFDEKFKEKHFKLANKRDGNSANVTKFWLDFRKAQINNLFKEVKSYVALDNERRWNEYLEEDLEEHGTYANFIRSFKEEQLTKDEQKTQLALIGRGWVKAGFQFDKLDERNFVYDSDFKTLHFFQLNAKVLNADINPWFIPERKVPGFDILTDKRADFEKLKETKIHAVDKLEKKSLEAGIVETAQTNGEEALKNFFSLITGEEIQHVVFHKDALIYEVETILADTVISFNEIFTINEVIKRNHALILNEKNDAIKARRASLLKTFLHRLQRDGHLNWARDSTEHLAYNYYTRYIPVVLQDSAISKEEFELLNKLKHQVYTNKMDLTFNSTFNEMQTYWVSDSLSFLFEYNDFISLLDRELRAMHGTSNETSSLAQIIYNELPYDTMRVGTLPFDSLKKQNQLRTAQYEGTDTLYKSIEDPAKQFIAYKKQAITKLKPYPITKYFSKVYQQLSNTKDSMPDPIKLYTLSTSDRINSAIALSQFNLSEKTFYTTDSIDRHLFNYDRSGAYQVVTEKVIAKHDLNAQYGQTELLHIKGLKADSVRIQFLPEIAYHNLTEEQMEVYAIRSYIMQLNNSALSIGPVIRARDYLSRNIFNQNRREQLVNGLRENAESFRKTIHKIGGR